MTQYRFGFRCVGGKAAQRKLVDWTAAMKGHAMMFEGAELHRESFLSMFQFDREFAVYLSDQGTTAAYPGPCWASFISFDVDNEADPAAALVSARRLAAGIVEGYGLDDDDLLTFFSGCKGYHLMLPTALWAPAPGPTFHTIARRFAVTLAENIGIAIDTGVYSKVQLFRSPNSRHPKTDLHKRCLSYRELMRLPLETIRKLAAEPAEFEIPAPHRRSEQVVIDWAVAAKAVADEAEATANRRAEGGGTAKLNKVTLRFIRSGAEPSFRHRFLFSSAKNLAECGAPRPLVHDLLTESALDVGLSPHDTTRGIDCGVDAALAGDAKGAESCR